VIDLDFDTHTLTRTDAKWAPARRSSASDLPIGLLRQATRRLRITTALVVVATLVSWVGINTIEGEFLEEFTRPEDWVAPTLGLVASVALFLVTRSSRLTEVTIIRLGLAYEVIVSYSMAVGQYWNTFYGLSGDRLSGDMVGVSAVALWMAFFTVLVPSRPRHALIALILSGTAVPVVMLWFIRSGNAPAMQPLNFFFIFVLPYVLTIIMCMVAASVIYGLGKDVHEAQRMGSYQLQRRIGQGGMGEVWEARHNFLARPAAVKLIHPDALGAKPITRETMISRFEREAQVTASLESPHTVELYDFGVSDDGTLFYVMELLRGTDLDALVRRFGPMPPERVVHLLRQACSSLAEAHRRGLIHRDIKPANIMLCEFAFTPDFVKILDFGLVKRFDERESDEEGSPGLTRLDAIAGTPAFAAPEIFTRKNTIDGRADLYSLGCVAFYLLTGRPVFEEKTAVALAMAHASEEPPEPGQFSETSVPAELSDLILSCLAKVPESRPASAEAVAERLDAIRLESPWTSRRARVWWDRHRPSGSPS
jgi:serine/threonine-protein kinase